MLLRNVTSGAEIANAVNRASNPLTRAVGLLGRASMTPQEGLWIDGCNAVHTMFMRATIDLYFLDAEGTVLKIQTGVKPWVAMASCKGAKTVLELGTGAPGRPVAVGDRIVLE